MDKSALRNAATVILIRDEDTTPRILLGQRGSKAAFMPNKFVFPGGAVDAGDQSVPLAAPINSICDGRLKEDSDPTLSHALQVAAVREVWEETGLVLGAPGLLADPTDDWAQFAGMGFEPTAAGFQFIFRAITPPGRPRRFDARFFLVRSSAIQGDPDDFSHASDELSSLQWVGLDQARSYDLPFITEVVLAEVAGIIGGKQTPDGVPFFRNGAEQSLFLRLRGQSPLDQQNQ